MRMRTAFRSRLVSAAAAFLTAAGSGWPAAAQPPGPEVSPRYQALVQEVFSGVPPRDLRDGIARLADFYRQRYGVSLLSDPPDRYRGAEGRAFHVFRRSGQDDHRHGSTANVPSTLSLEETLLFLDDGLRMERSRPAGQPNDPGFFVAGGMRVLDELLGRRSVVGEPGEGCFKDLADVVRGLGFGRATLRRGATGYEIEFQPMEENERDGMVARGEARRYVIGRDGLIRRWDL